MNCYLCHTKDVKLIYKIHDRLIYRCLNDDLFFSVDKKSDKFDYDQDYYEASPYSRSQSYFQNKLDKLIALTHEKSPTILDVGCGWGNFLQVVKNNSLSYLGIDLSLDAIKICQGKKLNCQEAD